MDAETSWRFIEQERLSLAALLQTLSHDQWNKASLCHRWRIKDVAPHVALAAQPPTASTMVREGVRAAGRFHTLNHDIAVRYANNPGVDLVAELREHAASRRLPAVTTYRNVLFDVLVHGQDIAIPLERPRAMPTDAARAGADRVWSMGWPFWAKRRFKGIRLSANDIDWATGEGHAVTGPIDALLLVLTGRPAGLPRLSGTGVELLRTRVFGESRP
jgi:uncharacterized protein (TIGR03083 family)